MKNKLPKYCFIKGTKIWFTVKDETGEWKNKPTPYRPGQEDLAARYVKSIHRTMGTRRNSETPMTGAMTLRQYIEKWLKEREDQGLASAGDERIRLTKYVLPKYGDFALEDFRPMHARDLVMELKKAKKANGEPLAPRTILHVFRTLKNVYASAEVDELVMSNPVKVKRGVLPKKVDKDPEWRINATYTRNEVERLISDPVIPVERRVQYALKALAGMRHQEVAALCWRHIEFAMEPLARINIVQAWDSRRRIIKSTKDEETRAVPMHPTLAKIIASWKLEHWERIYGRKPGPDDYIVPARTMNPVNVADAGHAMFDDLVALGLRTKAGKKRKRGGHDLRGWYKTQAIEDDADSTLIHRTTHAPPKNVEGGYQRFSWAAICREVSKLNVKILDGKVLPLLTASLPLEKRAARRWTSDLSPTVLESKHGPRNHSAISAQPSDTSEVELSRANSHEHGAVRTVRSRSVATLTRMIERAILVGDTARALRIIREAEPSEPANDSQQAKAPRDTPKETGN